MPYQIVGQVGIKIKTSVTGGKKSSPLYIENVYQSRWKGQFCKQNKLAKSVNFVSKFKAKHAMKNKVDVLKNHKTVFKATLVKDLNLLT